MENGWNTRSFDHQSAAPNIRYLEHFLYEEKSIGHTLTDAFVFDVVTF